MEHILNFLTKQIKPTPAGSCELTGRLYFMDSPGYLSEHYYRDIRMSTSHLARLYPVFLFSSFRENEGDKALVSPTVLSILMLADEVID